jgi:hypothetical protein
MRGTCILTGALLIAGLATGPGGCAAADGPDSLEIALRHQLEHRSLARVTGPWGAVRLTDPRATAAGLEFLAARPDTPATDPAPLPNPIPLAQVYAVEIRTNSAGVMAVVGGLTGALIGVTATEAISQIMGPNPPPSGGELLTGALMGAMPGAALGALIGSATRHWKKIYPDGPPPGANSR